VQEGKIVKNQELGRYRLGPSLLSAAIASAVVSAPPAHSATITVDSVADPGTRFQCTLRNAINSANSDATNTSCVTGSGNDNIVFAQNLATSTINLGSQLEVTSPMSISGPGVNQLAISGQGGTRVLLIDDDDESTNLEVAIFDLTIRDGLAVIDNPIGPDLPASGGGIFNRERLTLTNVVLTQNQATGSGGGLANSGTATLLNSIVSRNESTGSFLPSAGGGAGLYNSGDIEIERSTIAANTAEIGGGMINTGVATVVNSTFSANSAIVRAGNVLASGTVTLRNTTLFNGSAADVGGLVLEDAASFSLRNLVVAGSIGSDCSRSSSLGSWGGLFVEDDSCGFTGARSGDPKLGPLRDNGGQTLTHGPLADSPLIDGGNALSCEPIDQRNIARGADCDIGAVEVQPWSLNVSTPDDIVADDGECSLREAVTSANTNTASGASIGECQTGLGAAEIGFSPDLVDSTITVEGSPLETQASMTIGNTPSLGYTIRGENTPAFVNGDLVSLNQCLSGDCLVPNLTLRYLTIESAGIVNYGQLLVDQSTLTAYSAAVLNNRHSATLRNSTVSGNSGNRTIVSTDPLFVPDLPINLTIEQSTIADNRAYTAVYTEGYSLLTLDGAVIANNDTIDQGSGEPLPQVICSRYLGNAISVLSPSLIEDGSCVSPNEPNLLTGDAGLGPLDSTAGPTPVHLVQSGSPLIDAGSETCIFEDQRGFFAGPPRPIDGNADGDARCDPGAIEFFDDFPPEVRLISAMNITEPGESLFTIRIGLMDDAPIDLSQISGADLTAAGVNAIAATPNANGSEIDYVFLAPSGSWDYTDNGNYPIAIMANEIFDTSVTGANATPATTLGGFEVAIREIALSGNGMEIVNGDSEPTTTDGTDWGLLAAGQRVERAFLVSNIGAGTLEITGPVTVTGTGFSLRQPDQLSLGPAQATEIRVTFEPNQAGNFSAVVVIPNTDPDEPSYSFALRGESAELPDALFSDGFEN